jgi:steroid 5-alpha reductase family enzyme
MDEALRTMAASAGAIVALMVVVWLISLVLRDASIVDIAWGAGFVVVAWTAFVVADGTEARRWLMALMVSAWGLRLSGYLAWRNLGKGEDYRYQAMRRHWGSRFPIVSLFTVFLLQGVLMFVVSLPVQIAQISGGPESLTWVDFVGLGIFAVGLTFEAVGDWQLARFKSDPANQGKVMDRGLWRYTRHPNYFGDFVVWWGLFIVAMARPELAWTAIGPIVMSILLLRVSGVTLLERNLKRRRPGYEEYIRRTSSFFPLPPKRV